MVNQAQCPSSNSRRGCSLGETKEPNDDDKKKRDDVDEENEEDDDDQGASTNVNGIAVASDDTHVQNSCSHCRLVCSSCLCIVPP